MKQLREKGLGAGFLAVMMYEAGDPHHKTRGDTLLFVAHQVPDSESTILNGYYNFLRREEPIAGSGIAPDPFTYVVY